MPAFYLTNDLFFSSRVSGVAQRIGLDLRVANSLDKLPADCRLVVLDLTLPSLNIAATVQTIKETQPTTRIIAYGPHVQDALLQGAQAAGCDEVLSRGQFDREME